MINLATTFLLALIRRIKRGGLIINEHTLSVAQTRFHVSVLRRWFEFISLEELPRRLARPAKRPFCLLTFDDGKRSNFTETAPELERQRVPAAFYVTTDALTTGTCLWFDRRNQLVKAIGHCPAGLELDNLKQLPFDLLMKRLTRACARYGFEPLEESAEQQPMSWTDARSLRRRGFAIGAHGLTHAILTRETRKRAFAEIEESMAKVSREVGVTCTSFAFPNGNYDAALTRHALLCGARTVMTTDPAWTDERSALWQLPRVQLFGSASRSRIEAKIALAGLKGILSNPNGGGRRGHRPVPGEEGTLPTTVPVPRMGH